MCTPAPTPDGDPRDRATHWQEAIGDLPVSVRDTNPWNAHQAKYHIEHPKPRDMSNTDYAAAKRAAYYELFEHLSGQELTDPLVRADATAELMTWYRERQKLAVDKRKAAGHGMALLRKVAELFIHQSTSISNTYNIDIFGYTVDRFTDTAHIWGGSKPFSDANAMYPGDIQQDLFDWKARLRLANFFMHNSKTASNYLLTNRNVQMEHRRQANAQDEATQAMHIDFTKVKNESNQDGMRRQLSRLFLNQICTSSFPLVAEVASGNPVLVLIMLAREDHDLASIQNLFKKGFPWKWTAVAHRHKLRFEGWPAALKSTFLGPGFNLSHIKDSDAPADASRNKAMRDMHTTLKAIYLGMAEDDIQCTKIVSWTEDEQELDDPRDVAIVTCDDGTTLLTAAACTKLLRDLAPAKPKRSAKVNARRLPMRARPGPPNEPVPDSPAAEEPSQADFPSSLVPNRINCVYVNGNVVSSGFLVSGFHTLAPDEVPDEIYRGVWYHSNVTQALKDRTDRTLTWRHFATVGNEQWRKLPTSLLALWCGFLKQERHTTIVNYLVPGAAAPAPARTASRERQPTLKEQLRLVQPLVTQWFPFNGGRGNYEIETRPDQHLVLVMRHPDLPTGDLSPLPYPQPADEQESLANIRSVLCRAARRADAFFEFHAEMAAHDDNKSSTEYNEEYYSRLAKTALWGLKQPLGPRALAYVKRELTYGARCGCSATADDSPLTILNSIMAAEAKTAVLAVADARVAAEKALFLASTAQLAHTDTVGALVALRQAQAACNLVNRAIAAMASRAPARPRGFDLITWKIFEGDWDYSEAFRHPWDWALRHPWDRIMSCISLNVPFANNKQLAGQGRHFDRPSTP
ncbi:hypothetical protein K438DRAFT_1784890 [Mycena galopus ATCC 62051]|nr:hypothetical protein K438DRAFT_1784890 [Mycena galopus ATCC 62051]